ncbi:MAG: hypothetical protein ACTHK2_03870 [Dokdonella sp.]|uniref:hypothetical protein n=1 Tax=Dokdonella sp. TaxID=2291710 RepID=UPI003F7E7D3A
MKLAFDAPWIRGRMLPGIFTYIVREKERFPGDPWPHMLPARQDWYWMHSNACREAAQGTPYASVLCTDKHIAQALRDHLTPPKPVVGDDRPSVGSVGARQPADAGPLVQRELFAEARC